MERRTLAVIIALCCLGIIAFGVRGVGVDSSVGEGIAEIGNMEGQTIDPAEWVLHWRTYCGVLAFFGFCGLLAGGALFLERRWSWIMLATTVFAYLILKWVLFLTAFSKFAFEQPGLGRSAILLALGVAAVVAHQRWNIGKPNAVDA